ncbi:MAG: PaaI family thioesterase [Chitinophagales bacterium]|nr:PaaI family thioesterase [Chitinophagales bacterium]
MNLTTFVQVFNKANFIQELGCELAKIKEGLCEIHMAIHSKHLQQDGFVHAGVLATLADHAAGCAAYTVTQENTKVLTTEFKINLLRPAIGQKIIAISKVLKPGKMITVCQSEIFAVNNGEQKMVAIALVSIANT